VEISFVFKQNTITLDFTDIEKSNLEHSNNELIGKEGIYLLKDKSNKVIYIGITNNLGVRVRRHIKGTTHTSYFHQDIESISYYVEENDYEREALEKLLINALKPVYNETAKGFQRVEVSQIIAIKYLLGLRQYTNLEIANKTGVSDAFVSNVSTGKYYSDVEIPSDYVFKPHTSPNNEINKEVIEEIYLDFLGGKSIATIHSEKRLSIDDLKLILSSSQPLYKEIRDRVKSDYKRSEKDKLIEDVFRLRFQQGLTLMKIAKLKGITHSTVGRYLKENEEKFSHIKEVS